MKIVVVLVSFLLFQASLAFAETASNLQSPMPAELSSVESIQAVDLYIPEAVVIQAQGELRIKTSGAEYILNEPTHGESLRNSFESLGQVEKTAFTSKRKQFLGFAAKILNALKYGLAVAAKIKGKISDHIQNIQDQRLAEDMSLRSPGVREDFFASQERGLEERKREASVQQQRSLKTRAEEQVLIRLQGLDQVLWEQARLFSGCNEAGVAMAVGLQLLGGQGESGWGGLVDVGFTLGGNLNDKSFVFQIFKENEVYKSSTMPAIFMAGAVGKLGGYLANQKQGELIHSGTSFYPPMAPAFSSSTDSQFFSGASSGLTWPPSPIGDMLTYTNSLKRSVVLRLSVSPKMKGFIRIESSLGASAWNEAMTLIRERLGFIKKHTEGSEQGAYYILAEKIAPLCSQVFN